MRLNQAIGRPTIIKNPCTASGHRESFAEYAQSASTSWPWKLAQELGNLIVVQGTGEPTKCVEALRRVMWPNVSSDEISMCSETGRACSVRKS